MQQTQENFDREWGELLVQHQDQLERLIRVRMDPRLRVRVDATDVVQETFLEATRRRVEFENQTEMPLLVWLRLIALQNLTRLYRMHLLVKSRSAHREVMFAGSAAPSAILATQLLGQLTTPSQALVRDELEQKLVAALESLEAVDRECIILRNFERLTNAETASILGLNESTASSRYLRALQKLKLILDSIEGLSSSDWP
jgi:RNA polymerase sigma-70 factor (ECF subfamily)